MGEWVGMVLPLIFSHGFETMLKEEIDISQAKIYCSEMFLLALLRFIKKNDLTVEEVQLLNEKVIKDILVYNILKYPKSFESEINREIE